VPHLIHHCTFYAAFFFLDCGNPTKPHSRINPGYPVFKQLGPGMRPSKGGSLVALSRLSHVFLRSDVTALMVVNVAVVFVAHANVALALYIL